MADEISINVTHINNSIRIEHSDAAVIVTNFTPTLVANEAHIQPSVSVTRYAQLAIQVNVQPYHAEIVEKQVIFSEITHMGSQGPQGPVTNAPKGFTVFCSGRPYSDEIIGGAISPYIFEIDPDLCVARAVVASTGNYRLTIKSNISTIIGYVDFIPTELFGTITILNTDVGLDDYLTVHSPNTADATLADISIIIKGN